MATFFNQATLSYGGNTVNSNITEAELRAGVTVTKTAVSDYYTAGGNIVYVITVENTGATAYNALTLTDDLGAYNLPVGDVAVPLSYVDGSLLYYLNGVLQPTPTVTTEEDLQISGVNLPAGGVATFVYEAAVNEFAPISADSEITNTVSVRRNGEECVATDSATVPIREQAQLTIAKAVCPASVTCNTPLSYTIIVQNLGNAPVVATDGVVIRDVLNPALSDLEVRLDGALITSPGDYTYNEATGEFVTNNGLITVPAATYTQDPETGAITTTPGVTVLTITGTV